MKLTVTGKSQSLCTVWQDLHFFALDLAIRRSIFVFLQGIFNFGGGAKYDEKIGNFDVCEVTNYQIFAKILFPLNSNLLAGGGSFWPMLGNFWA